MAEFFKPFPQIPHDRHYEGDSNPHSVKPADSVFFTNPEKVVLVRPALLSQVEAGRIKIPGEKDAAAFRLIGKVLDSPNLKPLEQQIGAFVVLEYPQNLSSLRGVLEGTRPSDPVLSQRKAALEKALDKELAPPEGMRIKYRFHEHFVPSPEEFQARKDNLKDHIKGFFVKGEENIFIGEDMNGSVAQDNTFQDGLRKYGTYKMALIYFKICRQTGKIPDEGTVRATYDNYVAKSLLTTTPSDRYKWAEASALDELREEGYKFEFKSETGIRGIRPPELTISFATLDEYQQFQRNLVAESQERDRKIIKLVREIEKKKQGKTNVFIAMGSFHLNSTISVYPMRYGPITQMDRIVSWEISDNVQNEIFRRIANNEAIPDEMWQQGFQDFNAPHTSEE